jgi:hypothetical protein
MTIKEQLHRVVQIAKSFGPSPHGFEVYLSKGDMRLFHHEMVSMTGTSLKNDDTFFRYGKLMIDDIEMQTYNLESFSLRRGHMSDSNPTSFVTFYSTKRDMFRKAVIYLTGHLPEYRGR